jgi:hypothetical protein
VIHSLPFSAGVKNMLAYRSTFPYSFMARCLIKLKTNFLLLAWGASKREREREIEYAW